MKPEFCQNIAPYLQPQPARNSGGDCFACALTAGLQHLFPSTSAVAFDTCFDAFKCETVHGAEALNNSWMGMQKALSRAGDFVGQCLEIRTDIVQPIFDLDHWSHAWFRGGFSTDYYEKLEGYLREGWVVFTEIMFSGQGPLSKRGLWNHIDHFVILDGVRKGWEPCDGGKYHIQLHEVHVVCSARGAYWIDLDDLHHKHGAAGWILVRPKVAL